MFSKTFTYKGFDDQTHEDTWWFHYTQAELIEMNLGSYGGMNNMMAKLLRKENPKEIVDIFKKIILNAVGEKSIDGRRFVKNAEIREDFYQTQAYSDLFTELVSDGSKFAAFLKGCAPAEVREAIEKAEQEQQEKPELRIEG